MEEVLNFLRKAGTYYLGTVENESPDIRPFGTINIYDGKMYIQTGKKKNVYKQIKNNPKINICAMCSNEWIRIYATAVEDERVEAEQAMLDAYPNLQGMYKAGDGNNVVFYLENVTAKISAFNKNDREIKF